MENSFLSHKNIKFLYNLLAANIMKKYKYNITDDESSLLYIKNIMNKIFKEQRIPANTTDKDKNVILSKKVIDHVLVYYKNIHRTMNQTKKLNNEQLNNINRNYNTLNLTNENTIDSRPLPSSTDTTKNTVNIFNHVKGLRDSEITTENSNKNKIVKFDEDITTYTNINSDYDDLIKNRGDFQIPPPKNDITTNNFIDSVTPTYKSSDEHVPRVNDTQPIAINNTTLINNTTIDTNSSNFVGNELSNQFTSITDNNNKDELKNQFNTTNTTTDSFLKTINIDEEAPINNQNINLNYNDIITDLENISSSDTIPDTNIKKYSDIQPTSNIQTYSEYNIEDSTNKPQPIFEKNNDFFPEIRKPLQDIKPEQQYKYKTYSLLINSIDRKWYGDFNSDGTVTYTSAYNKRYSYSIVFAPESDNTYKIPIYENNEYIPLNINNADEKLKIIKDDRTLNTSGFIYNGKSYSTYKSNESKGEISDYEYGLSKGTSDSININRRFKNVVSVKLKRLILPDIDEYLFNNVHRQIYIGCKTEPYMLVSIDEFNSNIVSSASYNKNIFSKIIYDREYSFTEIDNTNAITAASTSQTDGNVSIDDSKEVTETRGYIHLIDEDSEYKQFYPSPLSELNKITFNLLRADGKLYSNVEDSLQVISIKQMVISSAETGDFKNFFTVKLNTAVHPHYFKQSDKIMIKNIICARTIPPSIIKYLNEGAYIYKRSNALAYTSGGATTVADKNEIYICHNIISYDNPTSEYDLLSTALGTDEITIKGFIINVSHQHSFTLEVKTKEMDSHDIIGSELI